MKNQENMICSCDKVTVNKTNVGMTQVLDSANKKIAAAYKYA